MAAPSLLLVEDDRLSREMFGDWLRSFGYSVATAASMEEGLLQLRQQHFDLIVTDLLLPGRDGLALLAEARKIDPEIDVIVVTALEQVAPAVRALRGGAADYLVKPIAKDTLELSVGRCLTARQLLRDNLALREQVALFERGRRVSATLEGAELWPLALSTLAESLSAVAGVLALLDPEGNATALAEVALPDNRSRELLDRLRPHLRHLSAEPTVRFLDAGAVAGLHEPVALVPCAHQGEVRSAAALVLRGLPPMGQRGTLVERSLYLARHVGLAQANASRFAHAEALAHTDDLTGLRNDRALRNEIDRLLANRPAEPLSLLFLDLDHFKRINDAHGHLVGSRVLAEVGRVLRGCVRDIDSAARYGGDEFAVVLPGADSGEALKVAERIRRAMAEHVFVEGTSLTVCIGIASHPEHGSDRDVLLTLADAAMYRGKRGQRNVAFLAQP